MNKIQFAETLKNFLYSTGFDRDKERSNVVKAIFESEDLPKHILLMLDYFISSARDGRLDDVVDIIVECDSEELLRQSAELLGGQEGHEEADFESDDHWHVLVMAWVYFCTN